jgi:hypothetical protein
MTLPLVICTGHWFGSIDTAAGVLLYLLPTSLWAVLASTVASLETKHTYPEGITPAVFCRRFRRVVPYVVLNTGMLPHQFSSFAEGLFGGLHSEFERTPKAASVRTTATVAAVPGVRHDAALKSTGATMAPPAATGPVVLAAPATKKTDGVKIHWPYVVTEEFYVAYQIAWTVLFVVAGLVLCSVGAAYIAACVLFVAFFYGDHAGKVAFVFHKRERNMLDARRSWWRWAPWRRANSERGRCRDSSPHGWASCCSIDTARPPTRRATRAHVEAITDVSRIVGHQVNMKRRPRVERPSIHQPKWRPWRMTNS